MQTFKQFLAETQPYFADYPVLRTHKDNLRAFARRLSDLTGIPVFRFIVLPFLIDNKPTFRFEFDVSLAKEHTDPMLIGKILQNAAKKDLENSYPKVTVESEVTPYKGSSRGGAQRVLFSLETHGEQKK